MKVTECDVCRKVPGQCRCKTPHFVNVDVGDRPILVRNTVDLEHVLKRILLELNLEEFTPSFKEVQVSTFEEDGAPPTYRGLHLMWPDGRNCHIAFTFQSGPEAIEVADRRARHPGHSGHSR